MALRGTGSISESVNRNRPIYVTCVGIAAGDSHRLSDENHPKKLCAALLCVCTNQMEVGKRELITNVYIAEMAAYTRWQNEHIYRSCEDIGPEERKRDRGMFFGSMHNTLEHICVVNYSILTFLEGVLPGRNPSGQPAWPDWDKLKSVRLEQDNLLSTGAGEWTEDWLAAKTTARDPQVENFPSIPRWVMVVQLFNHGTHHRSQVTSALHAMGIDYGATDIPWRPGAGYFAG